ncbi:type I-E CRISPR-associated protein Cse1/CasA [Oscillatoria sp. CS-180]|uniref:type I-E CRISPR-associated protein Cse1/CasA n=1 Tax=Oscillatoria sp. CS-180 TaxID=3021720 RepID=UPI00232C1520|nr:type I-E CRISPR-associated protein Cse1/CasA [Oscillatoria sp. CS-180]MDB9524386.1 type I-E CRISPR-associated protein Cse1/CasA [Oscillatoria sp. CS-180]
MTFDLTTKPWIPVVFEDFQLREVSLIGLFECWNEMKEVRGENPPTTLAIYRFLLAILHRAYQGPKDVDHWEEIEQDDGQAAIAYIKDHTNCFDLLHPERPFLQVASISQEAAAEIYQAYVLHGNNTSTVFCHEHQWSGSSLSIEEAARLVLRLHWFDVGGRKTGSSISAGVIPTMDAANVLVRGNTLKETLLLNLMQYNPPKEIPSVVNGEDLPAWERESTAAVERIPNGYIDYLTYQWRRVRLFFEGDRAVNVAFHGGDRIPKDVSTSQWECGVAYHKTKKGLFTVRLNLSRSLWRDSTAFLQSSDVGERPRIVSWVAELQEDEFADERLSLQVLGLSVDNAKPLGWSSEDFSAPMLYLKDKPLWDALKSAVQAAEDHQNVFRSFRGSPYHALAEVLKHGDVGALAQALDGESRYWSALDQAFPTLLLQLPKDDATGADGSLTYGNQVLPEWTKTVQKVATDAFTESIASIRNYEARAAALRSLSYHLAKLRGDIQPKAKKGKKATANVR